MCGGGGSVGLIARDEFISELQRVRSGRRSEEDTEDERPQVEQRVCVVCVVEGGGVGVYKLVVARLDEYYMTGWREWVGCVWWMRVRRDG